LKLGVAKKSGRGKKVGVAKKWACQKSGRGKKVKASDFPRRVRKGNFPFFVAETFLRQSSHQ
jgi:hypothetical protein